MHRLVTEEGGKVLDNFTNVSLASQCKKRSGYSGFPSTILLSSRPRTYAPMVGDGFLMSLMVLG